jgi:hypothetical protein
MKRIIYLIIGTFAIVLTLFSCAPEEITGIDQSGVPKISEMKVEITIEGKVVKFHSEEIEGCVPFWTITSSANSKKIDVYTKNDFQVTYKVGTYTAEVKAYNRNGVSDGSIVKEFVVQ